jgi:hypothetical protein
VLRIHVPIKVYRFLQVEMMSGFERTFLYRVELNTLYLYLKHRGQFADGTVLFGCGVVNIDLLDIECAINCRVYITGSGCNVDFDIAPPFFPRADIFRSREIRFGPSVEQAAEIIS